MYIKIHSSYRYVVALCDKELIGKKFEEGKRQLEVKEGFFKGDEVGAEEAVQALRRMKIEDATFNIVGEKSIKIALEAEIIDKGSVSYIDKVPFALVLL